LLASLKAKLDYEIITESVVEKISLFKPLGSKLLRS